MLPGHRLLPLLPFLPQLGIGDRAEIEAEAFMTLARSEALLQHSYNFV